MKSIDTSGATKTWEYQIEQLSEAIQEVGEGDVTAVLLDGGVPKRTRDALEERYPSIFVLLCAAHSLDLLLEDFYKKNAWVKGTIESLKDVVTFIKNHHKTLAMFRDLSKLDLLKPGETRFGSNFTMAESCIDVHDALEELVASKAWKKWVNRQKKRSKKDTAAEVKAIINNKEIWKDAKVLVKLSKPFVVTMKMADGDVPAMGKIYKRMFLCYRRPESTQRCRVEQTS